MLNKLKYPLLIGLGVLLVYVIFKPQSSHESATKITYPALKDYNLLFISLDTLRADRLGLYGYERETSPVLDELAAKSVVFDEAISVSSWTLPTHVTFFTGLFPGVHGVNRPARLRVDADTVMLAELMQDQGYRTFAYTGGGYVGGRYGFERGFEHYGVHRGKKRDDSYDIPGSLESIQNKILEFKSDEKFFIFLHTFDIHCPYNSPEPFMSMFNSDDAQFINPRRCGTNFYNKRKMTPGQIKYISDRYDGGIRWVDTKLKELFDFMQERGLMENTVIIVTSDHGEELHDHGSIGHKRSLYRELIRVPLIFYVPGVEPGRIEIEVSSVDIFDTIVEMLAIKNAPKTNGFSLWPLINIKDESIYKRKFQFSELDGELALRSHIDGEGHLINNLDEGQVMYFDLKKDPATLNNISDQETSEVRRRLEEIEILEKTFSRQEAETFESQSQEEIERLRSLGYL